MLITTAKMMGDCLISFYCLLTSKRKLHKNICQVTNQIARSLNM